MKYSRIFFSLLTIITYNTYGMESSWITRLSQIPRQCEITIAKNNPSVIVMANSRKLQAFDLELDTFLLDFPNSKNTYLGQINHALLTNGILKKWYLQHKDSSSCHIELLPGDNKFVAHSVKQEKSILSHSVELYSLSPSSLDADKIFDIYSFCYLSEQKKYNANKRSLLACHPYKKELACKIFNNALSIFSWSPRTAALVMHLLNPANHSEEREFNVLPNDIKTVIGKTLALLFPCVTHTIPTKIKNPDIYAQYSYHSIEYSSDGNTIALLYSHWLGIYDTQTQKTTYVTLPGFENYHDVSKPCYDYVSIKCHPYNNICALLRSDGSIFYWDLKTHQQIAYFPFHEKNEDNVEIGKKLAFSPDGTLLYVSFLGNLLCYEVPQKVYDVHKEV